MTVGGGSDGNFTAGAGCPTLDGLGAVGGGAHAPGEHVVVAEMPARARLVAALTAYVLAGGTGRPEAGDTTDGDPGAPPGRVGAGHVETGRPEAGGSA